MRTEPRASGTLRLEKEVRTACGDNATKDSDFDFDSDDDLRERTHCYGES